MGIHPVRASLALIAWLITGYMMVVNIPIVDAWWAIVGMVSAFYFMEVTK